MTTSSSQRLFFLDWLRIAVFGLLVPYHVGMYYVTWTFHVKSPYASKALEPWMMVSSPWRMSVIFLIAGAASAFMLHQRTSVATLRQRTRRLLLPLLVGVVLVVPPQTYLEVVSKFNYEGTFFEFLGLYFGRYKGFCGGAKCLVMPTWNHLWFLPYLWIYTCLLWLLLRFRPEVPEARSGGDGNVVLLLVMPLLFLLVCRWTLASRFPQTYDVVHDWYSHTQYLMFFLFGAWIAQRAVIWQKISVFRLVFFLIALASFMAFLFTYGKVALWIEQALLVSQQWCAVMAVVGYAKHYWNNDHPWRAMLTEAVFPFYIFHQTWILVLTRWLLPLDFQPAVEGPIIILLTFILSGLSYLVVTKIRWLRPFFGVSAAAKPFRNG